jgi:lipopolysaccharide heptosyltransferase II
MEAVFHIHDDTIRDAWSTASIRSILVIKPRAIGDVLLSTSVTPNLRRAFPQARIDFMTERSAADILEGNPYIDNRILYTPGKDSSLALFRRLYRGGYDLVFDLFCNPRTAQFTFATRAPFRVGYPFRGRAWAYNIHVRSRADRVHNTEFNLDALRILGLPVLEHAPVLSISPDALSWASTYVAEIRKHSGPLVAVNAGGTWESKRWGLEYFARLADELTARYNATVLLLYGPGERSDVDSIAAMMRESAVIPPMTTLAQLAALLSCCDATISNDSGPMHISAAVGVRTLGIFGPTNPHLQGPFGERNAWVRLEGLDCLACNKTECDIGNICMRDLDVDTVLLQFEDMMERVHEQA